MARLHSSVHQHGLARFASLAVLALILVGGFSDGVLVSAAPVALTCSKSKLFTGYAVVTLKKGLFLHFKNSPSSVDFALEAKTTSGAHKGWLSVGFSKLGKMSGADAVIGNLNGPKKIGAYFMKSIAKADVKPTTAFAITKTSVVTNAQGTIMKFTRSGPKGTVPVKYGAKNTLLWAYSASGASKVLDNHTPANRGAAIVNLGCKV
ncbi:unnamed protein product [Closterium sp. Yama58-4]|nr:unnamed protein product [Closterium sp. Yama58-4]